MKRDRIAGILDGIEAAYVAEASLYAPDDAAQPELGKRPVRRPRWVAAAACLLLAAALGTTALALAAEAGKYRSAMAFFEENGLPLDGLSRADVKAVYRDIVTQRFTLDKTADVLRRTVPGLEILQDEPTPEDLAALWNGTLRQDARPGRGISYRTEYLERQDEQLGFSVFDRSRLTCERDGAPLWTVEFTDFYVEDCLHTSAGTVAWGRNRTWSSAQPQYSWLALVDDAGTVRWERRLDHGFSWESVAAVLDNGDGTWAVVSRGELRYLCLSQYDAEGRELLFRKTEVGNLGVWNAVRLGDGYLIQLGNTTSHDTALLVRMDREGALLDRFTYEGEDCDYYLVDMAEFGGRIYLSAYAVPRQSDAGGRHEIADILSGMFEKGNRNVSDEELTALVRGNYTAVLLLCDPEGGAPQTFYTVRGSLGGFLAADDAGHLVWEVQSVVSTFFSPFTSSFTIGGTCRVYRYTFAPSGALLGQEDTGETVPYRR